MTVKDVALAVAKAAIGEADPYAKTKEALLSLDLTEKLVLLAVGKAAVPMARAAADVFGGRICRGLLVTKDGHLGDFAFPPVYCMEAAHPVPDARSFIAGEKALRLAESLLPGETLLVLLSGGGSALMEAPRLPPEDLRRVTQKLLRRGADIYEINAVRKKLSAVKGGKLAARAGKAEIVTVALSDVVGNDKSVIASGPTVFTPEDPALLNKIAGTYLPDEPPEVLRLLSVPEDPAPVRNDRYLFAGDLSTLLSGAARAAEAFGFVPHVVSAALTGEARDAAAKLLDEIPRLPGKHVFLWAGETTVTVTGSGKGGRNQEMALAAAVKLEGTKGIAFVSVASDGTDGPTSAAGGYADGETAIKMRAAGVDPAAALKNNDAYSALTAAGDLIVTGPTGTNVNDLTMIFTDL